jgi:hypothetical protein
MGDILAFPSRPAEFAKQSQYGSELNLGSHANDIAMSINAQPQIVKAMLLILTSLEAAFTALAKKIQQSPAGEYREGLLRQQTLLVLMVYQAQRLRAECEPAGISDRRHQKALVSPGFHNNVYELDEPSE